MIPLDVQEEAGGFAPYTSEIPGCSGILLDISPERESVVRRYPSVPLTSFQVPPYG
jgi:hypothetical protein